MKKICFLVSTLGSRGGTGRVTTNVANRMVGDYEVHVVGVCGRPNQEPAFPLDARIKRINLLLEEKRLRTLAKELYKPLKAYLKEHKIDIVFLVGNYQGFMALPVILTSSVKFVFCDHGALMNQWEQKDVRLMRALCSRFCDMTIVLTEESKKDYIERFRLSSDRVVAIYNWIPQGLISSAKPYNAQTKKIIWAGRLDPEKGVDLMLDIAAKVLPSHPGWEWDVFGEAIFGDNHAPWESAIVSSNLEGQLRMKGSVADLEQRYGLFAICVLTSYREGLPMVLLEAKANALPLVSFDVKTGPNEIINDGYDGYLIPCYDTDAFAEKLSLLMDDEDLRKNFSKNSQESLSNFSEEVIYPQWQAVILRLCG